VRDFVYAVVLALTWPGRKLGCLVGDWWLDAALECEEDLYRPTWRRVVFLVVWWSIGEPATRLSWAAWKWTRRGDR